MVEKISELGRLQETHVLHKNIILKIINYSWYPLLLRIDIEISGFGGIKNQVEVSK